MSQRHALIPVVSGIIAAVVCLGFAAFTGHIWEDYFITFRSSLNLASGHGLVFQPGERVHAFTSPLGTLLPALFALGGGDDVAVRALWGFRIVSAAALGSALWLATRTTLRHGIAPAIVFAIGMAWAFDAKIVDFSINGMEAALLIFFLTLAWHGFATGGRLLPLAIGCSGLQWTRPDGCVFFAVLAIAWLGLGIRDRANPWLARLSIIIRSIALGIAGYLPWLLFAWIYYGTPVPHTILAKISHHAPGELAGALALYPWRLIFGHVGAHDLFLPSYHYMGGWPDAIEWPARLMTVTAALAWVWPRVAPAGRVASAAFFLGGFYIEYIPRSPWYYPAWQALALIAIAYILDASAGSALPSTQTIRRSAVRITALLLVGFQCVLFACVAWQVRVQQTVIENGHRREIGRWLAAHAVSPRDTVFLECLGYIGFYSGLKMLDYPGLSSPEVVAARRAGHAGFANVIGPLQPTWLVLRPKEAVQAFQSRPELQGEYLLRRRFDVRAQVDAQTILPGRGYLNFDSAFLVFQRASPHDGIQ